MSKLSLTDAVETAMKKYPKARRIAVVNFSSSCSSTSGFENAANLEQDRQAYGWKADTVSAIKMAIKLQGKPI